MGCPGIVSSKRSQLSAVSAQPEALHGSSHAFAGLTKLKADGRLLIADDWLARLYPVSGGLAMNRRSPFVNREWSWIIRHRKDKAYNAIAPPLLSD
jgi:hypothetical protein